VIYDSQKVVRKFLHVVGGVWLRTTPPVRYQFAHLIIQICAANPSVSQRYHQSLLGLRSLSNLSPSHGSTSKTPLLHHDGLQGEVLTRLSWFSLLNVVCLCTTTLPETVDGLLMSLYFLFNFSYRNHSSRLMWVNCQLWTFLLEPCSGRKIRYRCLTLLKLGVIKFTN